MDCLLTEMGPWRVNGNLSMSLNPYSWSTEVDMIFIEQPYGVEFSVIKEGGEFAARDVNAANDMHAGIRIFLSQFVHLAPRVHDMSHSSALL